MYHRNRAIQEQLRGPLAYKRKIDDIYEKMLDDWSPQGDHINFSRNYGPKRIRRPHKRAAKRYKAQRMSQKSNI